MKSKLSFGALLLLLSCTALAAPKYYIAADIVRGTPGAQGPACVANTVFYPGEQIVWRAIVFDAATQTQLSEEQVKKLGIRVTIAMDNGANLNMRLGLHPPNPKAPKRDLFWSASYPIATTAALGNIKWSMATVDSDGNTGSYSPIGQEAGLNLLTIVKPAAGAQSAATDGAGLYGQYCAACHQANGQGVPGAFPALAGSGVVNGDAGYLTQLILTGLEGRISIKGQNFDGNMPGMGGMLNDSQVASILTYIRSAWSNKSAALNEGIVKAERSKASNAKENYARYPK
ncbi:MAG: c-type cytochrome [Burkholderiales bacterium]